ncbi:MAG TPA: hypothetical protein VLA05_00115 [Coriobacteriia bacterium]|nr:hypothetical protein [Coriobacteriia bacterium]
MSEEPLLTGAISSWWCRSNSVYQSHHGITYQTGVSFDGKWMWSAYEHETGITRRAVLGTTRSDDHNTPAVFAPSNRPPIVFYTGHNTTSVIRYRVSRSVGDLDPGPERSLTLPGRVTYVQVHRGNTDDTLILLTRAGDQWLIAVSRNYGGTWSVRPLVAFESGNYGYLISSQLGNGSIRLCAAGHPKNSNLTSINYAEISPGGTVRDAEGTLLGNIYSGYGLPINASKLTPVYSFPPGMRGRLFDVSAAPEPEIGFAQWSGEDEATYMLLRGAGNDWQATPVIPSGQPIGFDYATRYLGGLSFPNPTAGGEFFISREESGTWQIERWQAEGDEWDTTRLAESADEILARPLSPLGAGSDLPLTWLKIGSYGSYLNFTGSTYGGLTTDKPDPALLGRAVSGDWDGDGREDPGVFSDGTWTLQVDGESVSFTFGRAGDVPVVGDWNAEGRDSIGVKRGRKWILAETIHPDSPSREFAFGKSEDIPLAGDWNGDGKDGIGVRRGRGFILRNAASAGRSDISFDYGRSTDTALVGDWDGNGRDDIGIRRGASWYLRKRLDSGPAQVKFTYGRASDVPVVGDWGNIGLDAPGVRRGSSGIWYVVDTRPGLPRADFSPSRFLY